MKHELNNDVLVITLEGRIDSNTSIKCEKEIDEIASNNPHTALVLNFEYVDFLSSAGLRMVLRLKKKERDFKVVDVTPDVFEIFEMTGFSEIMDIQKGFRRIDVSGCEEIGRGANGIVYRYADDMIVKVYFNNAALESIKNEIRLAKKAFVSGVSTAIPFDIVKVGPYLGSVFEMIEAESLPNLINAHPEKLDEYIEQIVDLLKIINGTIIEDDSLPTIKDKVLQWVNIVKPKLDDESYQKLYKLIKSIKDDNNMLHRDYHIKNLLMQKDELILIDMDTLSKGNIIFELTGIYNAYRGFVEIRHSSEPIFLGIKDEYSFRIWEKTKELYFDGYNKEEIDLIEKKIAVVSSLQLLKIHVRDEFHIPYVDEKVVQLTNKLISLIKEVDDLCI